ncbi:MAG: hypothetical protein FWF92_11665 [Oscillospiraceae bacterium]|nr:hypothetical protein [Oscillospiraceae bacterium]
MYLTDYSQEIIDKANNIRCKDAEIIWTQVSVEPVQFNRGFYRVDIRFFFKITCEACVNLGRSQEVEGIVIFDKTVILFGSEGNVNIFKSDPASNNFCFEPNFNSEGYHSNLPIAVVEVVDPICLGVKIIEKCDDNHHFSVESIPEHVHNYVRGQLMDEGEKDLVCTLGIFAIIRLERPTQIVVPYSDFYIPEKECIPVGEEEPCELFKKMKFPLNEFFPQPLKNISFTEEFVETDDRERDREPKPNCRR